MNLDCKGPALLAEEAFAKVFDCIVVGDVMIDVVLRSESRIKSLNLEGTNYFSECRVVNGGSGNLSAAISALGGRTAFIGKAGDDYNARLYQKDLSSLRVPSGLEFDSVESTGLAICLVEPGGRRTMLVCRGANDRLTPEEVNKSLQRFLPSRFVYISGYSLANSPQREAVLRAALVGQKTGSKVVFDPGSSNLIRDNPAVFKDMVEKCDLLCSNLQEATALARGRGIREYASLLSRTGKVVLVKLGPRGCLVASGGKILKVPGVPATTVDTTGAGDAFLGAFLYCISHRHTMTTSAAFGNWFASKKTEGLGPRHFPSRRTAMQYLAILRRKRS